MTDEQYLKHALHLAEKGKGTTSPNPMVGAVIVRKGKIIAEGWHRRYGGDHAEIDALKKIKHKAAGATLFVNLEPCSHYGRTPPCVDAVIKSGIKRVVIGMKDPNPLTHGKSIQKLKRKRIAVTVGILREACEGLNEAFVKLMKKKMPFVTAKSAQSIDGRIALANGDSKWITSDATRAYARHKRAEFDAIIVGINTVLKDNPRLDVSGSNKRIKKVIVDSSLKVSLSARLFKHCGKGQCVVATTKKASRSRIRLLMKRGVTVLIDPSGKAKVDLKWLLKDLAKASVSSVLLEGGASLIGSALKEKLVDRYQVYIAPKILGDKALGAIGSLTTVKMNKALTLRDMTLEVLADDLLLEGYVQYR